MTGVVWLEPVSGDWAQGTATSSYFNRGFNTQYIAAAGTTCTVIATTDDSSPFDVYGTAPPPPEPTTGHTYLRQRQSPVRSPSRVRGVDLRARQTPYIT